MTESIPPKEARQGNARARIAKILLISLTLAIVAGIIVYAGFEFVDRDPADVEAVE